MGKNAIKTLLSKNLKAELDHKYGVAGQQSAFARDIAKFASRPVSQKTISNILSANTKGEEELEEVHSPTLEVLAAMAEALDTEPWKLIHPDTEQAVIEMALIKAYRASDTTGKDFIRRMLGTNESFGAANGGKEAATS